MEEDREILCYKHMDKTIYLRFKDDESVHFVPKMNWNIYIEKRLNVPKKCRIFNTLERAEEAMEEVLEDNYTGKHKFSIIKTTKGVFLFTSQRSPCNNSKCIEYNELVRTHCMRSGCFFLGCQKHE